MIHSPYPASYILLSSLLLKSHGIGVDVMAVVHKVMLVGGWGALGQTYTGHHSPHTPGTQPGAELNKFFE